MVSAIILAGGKGKRMGKDISKQFILVKDKPIIYYTIKKFTECKLIDEIILVLPKDEIEYCSSKKKNAVQHFAVRFAGKEAVWKAINKFKLSKGLTANNSKLFFSFSGKFVAVVYYESL